MVSLEAAELTLLLKLLGCEGYRSDAVSLAPSRKMSVAQRDRICLALAKKELIDYEQEIARFAIAPPGRTLLTLDSKNMLLTPDELKVLRACNGSMTPEKLSKIPESSRQGFIRALAERGLVKVTKQAITQVWLTAAGRQFLLYDYVPEGERAIASATLFGNYVRFLRAGLVEPAGKDAISTSMQPSPDGLKPDSLKPDGLKPDRQALVKHIKQLDQTLKTDNRLPIFYLREQLQPTLTPIELDDMLEALERNHRLKLSPLTEPEKYTEAQVAAGIQKEDGSCLFFISLS
ncbi:MAG: hypothetical protein AAFP09_04185 [Cyanobacteria bacterium J06607_10]